MLEIGIFQDNCGGDTRFSYYYGDSNDKYVVAENINLALEKAKIESGNPNLKKSDLSQGRRCVRHLVFLMDLANFSFGWN